MPDEDATPIATLQAGLEQFRTIGEQVIAAGRTCNETNARLDNVRTGITDITTRFSNLTTNIAALSEKVTQFREAVRGELMARLDRLQDAQTEQRLEMEVLIQLVRDSSPTELLALVRQLQDDIRELKEEKDRPSPPQQV